MEDGQYIQKYWINIRNKKTHKDTQRPQQKTNSFKDVRNKLDLETFMIIQRQKTKEQV